MFVYDTATGKQVGEVVPRVNTGTAGGDLAWAPDGKGFYYTRHPREGERPAADMNFYQQVYFHKLGTPTDEDRYELGKDSPRIAETELKVDERTGRVLATVQNGDGGEFAHFLRTPEGNWRQFSQFRGQDHSGGVRPGRRSVRRLAAGRPAGEDRARADRGVDRRAGGRGDRARRRRRDRHRLLAGFDRADDRARLYVVYQLGGPSEIRVFDHDGKPQTAPEQLPVSSVGHLARLEGDDCCSRTNRTFSRRRPIATTPRRAKVEKTAFKSNAPVDLDDAEVVREFATSKDGTKVPVNIIFRKGTTRDGTNPALVTGYGGYGVNYPPGFRALNRVLLDHGFVFAVANIRGGGEFGEAWHREGNLTKKQNVFDDFAASLEHLIERKYTSSDKLAIIGGSNGGLLMGAMLTQHPELCRPSSRSSASTTCCGSSSRPTASSTSPSSAR